MRVPAKKVMARVFRSTLSYLAPSGVILGYHRVSDATWDPLNLAISKKIFRNHLEIISDKYDPVSLRSLLAMKRQGKSLKGCVSITFDDGCEDFVRHAVPELVSRNIPATIFIATGYAGKRFWWDEVSYLMSCRSLDIDKMEIDFGGTGGKRGFEDLANDESAGDAVREICGQLLYLESSRRSDIIDRIRRQTSGDRTPAYVPCAMTRKQLQELSAIPLVEIAAHSVTHPLLSQLSEDDQLGEIQGSKSELEALGKTVTGFSYPNGSFSLQTCDLVKNCGFGYACTSLQAAVRRRTDCYRLPRIWAPNVGGQEFRRWMSVWSGLRN